MATSTLPSLDSLSTSTDTLQTLNSYLSSRSYISGYTQSDLDLKYFQKLSANSGNLQKFQHVSRWMKHIGARTGANVEEAKPQAQEKGEEAAPAADDLEMDEDDLFGDDDTDNAAAAALQERLAKEAKERAAKKLKNARSLIVLEVKPYEADFDLETLALGIKELTHEGIQNWGQEHKLVPIAYGIKKLVISVVVYDELISVDDISEMIEEKFGEDVQSIDVQAMSKV